MKYDFIVIGAGLAGSYFTYLASKFSSVLLVDKVSLQRETPIYNIFEQHNNQFFEDGDFPLDNEDIFTLDHNEIVYSGKQHQGIVDGREFGTRVGKFCNISLLSQFYAEKAEKNGAELLFNTEVKNVVYSYEGMKVDLDGKEHWCDVVLLATGSQDFKLQQHLGFHIPSQYWGVFTRYTGDSDTIRQNIPNEYIFHYNRKISPDGPLYTTRGKEHFELGMLHKDKDEAVKKLLAVIARYDFIENYFTDVEPMPLPGAIKFDNGINIFTRRVSKGPLKQMARDRVLLLGECAGLVTPFFYEGTTGCLCSAKIAADLLKTLNDQEIASSTQWFNATNDGIGQYTHLMKNNFINTYLKSQKGSEDLFINSGSAGEDIFNVYADLLSKRSDLRNYVYQALVLDDLSKYKLANDRKSGEAMYAALPMSKKLLYSPHFLRASFN